jgi:signal transduction histidine kinase
MKLAANSDRRQRAHEDEVAHAASHELRAPVVAIGQIAESIQEDFAGELPEEVSRRLVQLRAKADRLDALLRGLNRYQRAGRTSER